jgi:GNAT superfamily N-acetyltransferase
MTLAIRSAGAEGLAIMTEWAVREGWNPGLADAAAFLAADPDGFLVAEDKNGLRLGCISAVRQGAGFGFIGFYIVQPEHRGQGIGMALWQQAIARLAGRVVGLDGVVAQQANYGRSGFRTAWRNIRFAAVHPRAVDGGQGTAVPAASLPFAALCALDASVLPAPRGAFLRAWIETPNHHAVAVLRDGVPAGFGVARPGREGLRIGPLTAIDAAAARTLFNALLEGQPGAVFLDLPEPNPAALALAEAAGMAPVFETARMYAGPAPAIPLGQVFGLASFELG